MKFKWTLLSICGALVSALLAYAFTRLIPSPDQGGLLIVCILAYMWAGFGFGRSFYSEALQKAGADSPLAEGRHPTLIAAFLFASWHLDIAGVLNRTLFGVLLGWLLIATGSVVPGMIIHGIYDAFLEGNRAWHIHALYVYDHFRIVHAPVYPWLISLLVGALLTYSGWMLCRSGFKKRQPIPVAEPEVAFIG